MNSLCNIRGHGLRGKTTVAVTSPYFSGNFEVAGSGSSGTQYIVCKAVGSHSITFTNGGSSTNHINVFIVAGGASGGSGVGCGPAGGGGAGGYVSISYTLAANTSYTITCSVRAGGTSAIGVENNGSNTTFTLSGQFALTAIGGGVGADGGLGTAGGSGGGGGYSWQTGGAGTVGQGNAGGLGSSTAGYCGGGGGAGAVGGNGGGSFAGNGGAGIKPTLLGIGLTGDPYYNSYFCGGGGGTGDSGLTTGGIGGGGAGAQGSGSADYNGQSGTVNTGGGGGCANLQRSSAKAGAGGSGIIIIAVTNT